MVRILENTLFNGGKAFIRAAGLSTDTKPTANIITGSRFYEVDTGAEYAYDEDGVQWNSVGLTSADMIEAINDWLDDHPEATTTVEDGAISYAKLNSSLQGTVDDVGDLKSAIDDIEDRLPSETRTPTLTITSKKTWTNVNGTATLVDNTTTNFRASNAVAVVSGEKVALTFSATKHTDTTKAVFVTDADYGILMSFDAPPSQIVTTTYQFTVPETGAYFMINQWASSQPTNFTITKQLEIATKESVDLAVDRVDSLEDFDASLIQNGSATANLLDYRPFLEGHIDSAGGFVADTPATYKYIVSGFIRIQPGVEYSIRRLDSDSIGGVGKGYYYYDADKSYITGETYGTGQYYTNFTPPNNAVYVRLYFYIGKAVETYLSIPNVVKNLYGLFEYGMLYVGVQYVPDQSLDVNYRCDFIVNTREFAGKTIAILSDSIGTRQGFNTPEILIGEDDVGNELSAYVTNNDVLAGLSIAGTTYTSEDIGTEVTFTPTIDDIGKSIGMPLNHGSADDIRWWQLLCQKLGMNAVNASWSGATIVSQESLVEHGTYDCSCAWFVPTIRRCGIRVGGSMTRNAPDYIFVHRGINDFSTTHSGNYTVLTNGVFDAYNYAIPETDQVTIDDSTKYDFKQAYAMTIQKLRDAYPKTKIICCTIAPFKRHSETHYPPQNGHYSLPQFNAAIREVAAYFGCPVCEFAECYTYERLNFFTADNTHPNKYGHRAMYEKALLCLTNNMQFNG